MAPTTVFLPNGQTITVSPIFGGFSFKANDLNIHHSIFPPGWTVILETSNEDEDEEDSIPNPKDQIYGFNNRHSGRYKKPTLQNDHLFISSISNPSSADFKPATSPTRQIAMMLWATLLWYFHQVRFPSELPIDPYTNSIQVRTKPPSQQGYRSKNTRGRQTEGPMEDTRQARGHPQGQTSTAKARANGSHQYRGFMRRRKRR